MIPITKATARLPYLVRSGRGDIIVTIMALGAVYFVDLVSP